MQQVPHARLDDLKEIRKIMEKSSTFLSISGLSGVFIGIVGIISCMLIGALLGGYIITPEIISKLTSDTQLQFTITAIFLTTFIVTVVIALLFSFKKAKSNNLNLFTRISVFFTFHLLFPLVTGGLFIFILYLQKNFTLILPSMLIFYGISLVSASKFTYKEIGYLGVSVTIIGFLSILQPSLMLLFWLIGFGICMIGYGVYIHKKYEK